jgi:hypothetical protein
MVSLLDKNEDTKPFSVDRGRLCQVTTPKPTLTWTPLPHSRLMDSVEGQLEKRGYRVHNSTCLLSHGGDRFFGTVSISNRENLGYRRMIGARNSHDKSLAAGLIAGAKVTVCSNGWFFGDEIALSRKHTSRLFEDLDERIEAGFSRIFEAWEQNDLRIVNYREKELSDGDAHDLVVRSMDADAVAPSALPRVLKEYREPWHEEFMPRTAWSLYNAFTEVMKGLPHLLPERTRALTRCFDEELGIA